MSKVRVLSNDTEVPTVMGAAGDGLLVAYFTATWSDSVDLNIVLLILFDQYCQYICVHFFKFATSVSSWCLTKLACGTDYYCV